MHSPEYGATAPPLVLHAPLPFRRFGGYPLVFDQAGNAGPYPLIFISAAEASADRHGAALIRAARNQCPSIRFVGVAGPEMVAEGCDRIFDFTGHAAMLAGAVGAVGRGVAMLRTADRHLRRYGFHGAVVIDSPTLHLPLAARAQAAGVPVMYYIAPQVWAWGQYRTAKLRERFDRVAVILPFEEPFLRQHGVNATYVGHPLAEQVASQTADAPAVKTIKAGAEYVIALLPGSRRHVIREVLPGQLEVAERIASALPGVRFVVSIANTASEPWINHLAAGCRADVRTYLGRFAELIAAADLVLVASGTAALEVAFHRRPMIVMYNVSPLFYHFLARWLIRTRYLSLPNILAGREVVPEFMPYYRSTVPIAERAVELLRFPQQRQAMTDELAAIVEPLRGTQASVHAAAMLLEMVNRRRT